MVPLDARSIVTRTQECNIGNLAADICRFAWPIADAALLCGGTIRSDAVIGPGEITLMDMMEMFPFEDPVMVIRIRGDKLWEALESSVSMYPKLEGRFPQVSGMRIVFDAARPSGKRLLHVWMHEKHDYSKMTPDRDTRESSCELVESDTSGNALLSFQQHPHYDPNAPQFDEHALDFEKYYNIVTRQYLFEGNDGFDALKGAEKVIDEEQGILMSTLMRRFFVGLKYVNAMRCYSWMRKQEVLHHVATKWKNYVIEGKRARTPQMERVGRKHLRISGQHDMDTKKSNHILHNAMTHCGRWQHEELGTVTEEKVENAMYEYQETNWHNEWMSKLATVEPFVEGRVFIYNPRKV